MLLRDAVLVIRSVAEFQVSDESAVEVTVDVGFA